MRRGLLLAAALLASGCFRLTDPVYAFKGLRAPEPEQPGDSLVFGTIALEGFFSGSVDSIVLQRVSPRPGEFTGVTEEFLFRVFQRRPMKDGSFVMTVEPGMYEIVALAGTVWMRPQRIRFGEQARVASRFTVTRPGVYDIGVLRLRPSGGWGSFYEGTHERGDADPQHAEILRGAVAGTAWERYLVADRR
ncbi:MAG TPA: hypothetical protein VF904_18690 [Anaeromyxobacteraceae bacterium]